MLHLAQWFSEEKSFESVDGRRTTDGRRRLPILKAPPEPSAQGSEKLSNYKQFICNMLYYAKDG